MSQELPGASSLDKEFGHITSPDSFDAIRYVERAILDAVKARASDIHFEPRAERLRLRIRVDGILCDFASLHGTLINKAIARCKILSEMDIHERRKPQDGRILLQHEGKDYDLRVNSLPTCLGGEDIVMRILDKGNVPDLSSLGFEPDVERQIRSACLQPNGMVIFTGPTGSGKSTTQYAILSMLNDPEKKILTIENPVEYQLEGLVQVQTNLAAGLTFDEALRAFLRHDPDIIMVGEMRDLTTAKVAIESALTGHLVLSTLHTNNAPSAVTRLVEMGIEPHLVPDTVTGVLAQRLPRRICTECKEPYVSQPGELDFLGYKGDGPLTLFRGRGCEYCEGRKFRGRIGIYEFMVMDEELGELVCKGSHAAAVHHHAMEKGMQTLAQNVLSKILSGETTPSEAKRVVFTCGS